MKHKSWKTILCLLMILCLAATLFACSGTDTTTGADAGNTPGNEDNGNTNTGNGNGSGGNASGDNGSNDNGGGNGTVTDPTIAIWETVTAAIEATLGYNGSHTLNQTDIYSSIATYGEDEYTGSSTTTTVSTYDQSTLLGMISSERLYDDDTEPSIDVTKIYREGDCYIEYQLSSYGNGNQASAISYPVAVYPEWESYLIKNSVADSMHTMPPFYLAQSLADYQTIFATIKELDPNAALTFTYEENEGSLTVHMVAGMELTKIEEDEDTGSPLTFTASEQYDITLTVANGYVTALGLTFSNSYAEPDHSYAATGTTSLVLTYAFDQTLYESINVTAEPAEPVDYTTTLPTYTTVDIYINGYLDNTYYEIDSTLSITEQLEAMKGVTEAYIASYGKDPLYYIDEEMTIPLTEDNWSDTYIIYVAVSPLAEVAFLNISYELDYNTAWNCIVGDLQARYGYTDQTYEAVDTPYSLADYFEQGYTVWIDGVEVTDASVTLEGGHTYEIIARETITDLLELYFY